MNRARPLALAAWTATALVVGGLSGTALVAAHLPVVPTVALAALAVLVSLLCAGAVGVAVRARLAPALASGCGACGQSCLRAGSGSVDSRACSSTS